MNITLYTIITILVLLVDIIFLRFIIKELSRNKRLICLAWVMALSFIWQGVNLIISLLGPKETIIEIFLRISDATIILLLTALAFFNFEFFYKGKLKNIKRLISGATSVCLLMVLFLPTYFSGFKAHRYLGYSIEQNPYHNALEIYILILFAIILISILLICIRSKGQARTQAGIILAGLFLSFSVAGLTDLLFPHLGIQFIPLGGLATVFFIILYVFGVFKHELHGRRSGMVSIRQKLILAVALLFFGYLAVTGVFVVKHGANQLIVEVNKSFKIIGGIVSDKAMDSVNSVIGRNFERLAYNISISIQSFLRNRELDTKIISIVANNHFDDPERLAEFLSDYQISNSDYVWYNTGTDLEPVEQKELLPYYKEIGIIDSAGRELIKIIDGKSRDDLRLVSLPANTEFKNEDYFAKTKALKPGEVYVSRVQTWYLSEVEARTGVPDEKKDDPSWSIVPGRDTAKAGVIRFATPIYNGSEFRGIVVLSLDYRHLQEQIKHIDPAQEKRILSSTYEGNYILFFDDEGNTIVHPKPNNIRGYQANGELMHANTTATPGGIFNLRDYDKSDSYQKIFNTVINQGEFLVTTAVDVGGRRKMTISAPVPYGQGEYQQSGYFGGIMMSVNTEEFFESINTLTANITELTESANNQFSNVAQSIFNIFLAISFLSVLMMLILLFFFMQKAIINPLNSIRMAVTKHTNDQKIIRIEKKGNDEIGYLARSIEDMALSLAVSREKLKEQSQLLTDRVSEKTDKLRQVMDKLKIDKNNLELQRLATLNILEDISESKKEIESANQALKQKSLELEALKTLSNELTGTLDVEQALKLVNTYLDKLFMFDIASFVLKNPIEGENTIYQSYLKNSVNDNDIEAVRTDLIKYVHADKALKNEAFIKIIKDVNPRLLGHNCDAALTAREYKSIFIKMKISDRLLGVVQISSADPEFINNNNNNRPLLEAIIVTLAFSIDRLNTLIMAQHSKTVSLVQSLSDGVVMINPHKKVNMMNPAFKRYTGFSEDFFDIGNLYKLFPDKEIEKMIDKAIVSGEIAHIEELKIINKYYEMIISPVYDNEKKIVGCAIIVHDITHLKEIDTMKTEFVSVASHQLRTPLTAIKLFSEMMIKGDVGKLNPEQSDYLKNIYESTERMVRLVNDLLSLSRLESGRLRIDPVLSDLNKLASNIINEIKPLAENKGIKIELKTDDKLPLVPVDPILVRQVIHNLITNSVRYSNEKSGLIKVGIEHNQSDIIFTVADNGIGIPDKLRARIFEKFYRADNAVKVNTEGTGLGLYVSQMIVKGSGGKIWYESAEGKGTKFFVTLPLTGMKAKTGDKTLAF